MILFRSLLICFCLGTSTTLALPTLLNDHETNLRLIHRLCVTLLCQNTSDEQHERHFTFEGKNYLVTFKDNPAPLFDAYLNLCRVHFLDPKQPFLNCRKLVNDNVIQLEGSSTDLFLILTSKSIAFSLRETELPAPFSGISIILPMYNRPAEALACLCHLITLITLPESQWEIILVDDGSTDGSGQFLKDYCNSQSYSNVRIIWTPKEPGKYRNVGWTRNAGAKVARYPILAFCDCDQFHLSDPVGPTLAAFAKTPHCFVTGNRLYCTLKDGVINAYDEQNNPPGWVAIRKDLFMRMGGYDERFDCWVAEDIDMRKRLLTYGLWEKKSPLIHYTTAIELDTSHRETPEDKRYQEDIVANDYSIERNKDKNWGCYLESPVALPTPVHFRRKHP